MDTGYKLRRHAGVVLDNEHYVYGLQANVYGLLVGLTTSWAKWTRAISWSDDFKWIHAMYSTEIRAESWCIGYFKSRVLDLFVRGLDPYSTIFKWTTTDRVKEQDKHVCLKRTREKPVFFCLLWSCFGLPKALPIFHVCININVR